MRKMVSFGARRMGIKKFTSKMEKIFEEEKRGIENWTAAAAASFKKIAFERFDFENPYKGERRNKVFFVYIDHSEWNMGAQMQLEILQHPYESMYDKGYLKGVATDLNGYLILREAYKINHGIGHFAKDFNLSGEFLEIFKGIASKLEEIRRDKFKELNVILREMTGCSLLYYLNEGGI